MDSRIFSGKYEVQREIAKGGMGVIYHALDISLRRDVAIKVLHPQFSSDPAFAQRFLREARAMARLDHPNIMRIYAVEEEQNSHYIVMEYSLGKDLKDIIGEQGPLSLDRALRIAVQMTEALAYAHHKGIVHRDIKPSNIMLVKQDQVKITDFGIAAALDESSITITGTVIGTPEYMSPEQARGEQVEARGDLYSLGIVMYEMVTGKTPYKGLPGPTIIGKLAYETSDPILSFPQDVPPEVQDIIRGLIKKQFNARLSDTRQITETLNYYRNQFKAIESDIDATMVLPKTGLELTQATVKMPEQSTEQQSDVQEKPLATPEPTSPYDSKGTGRWPSQDPGQPSPTSTIWVPLLVGITLAVVCFVGIFYVYQWPFSSPGKKEEVRREAKLQSQTQGDIEPQSQEAKNEHLTTLETAKDVDKGEQRTRHKANTTPEARQVAKLEAAKKQEKARADAMRQRKEAKARAKTKRQRLRAEQDRINQQRVETSIAKLGQLQQEFQLKDKRHQKIISELTATRVELKQQADEIRRQADQKDNRAKLDHIRQTLTTLHKRFTKEHNHQISISHELSAKAKKAIKDADQIIKGGTTHQHYRQLAQIHESLSTIKKTSTERLNTQLIQWDEYFTNLEQILTQAKQDIQLAEKKQERERQQLAEEKAKAEQEQLLAEQRRIETEHAAKVESERLRQEEEKQKQIETASHNATSLTQELKEKAEEEHMETSALFSKIQSLSENMKAIHAQSTSESHVHQLDEMHDILDNLSQEFLQVDSKQRANTEALITKVKPAILQLKTISKTTLNQTQLQRVNQVKQGLLAAKEQLIAQQASQRQTWQTAKLNIEEGLKQTKIQIIQAEKNREAEAKRQRQESKQIQVAAVMKSRLERHLSQFQKAYENHDLQTLQVMTTMDPQRKRFIKALFMNYPTIEVGTMIHSITNDRAMATIVISKLINREGQQVTPSPVIKETKITIPKEGKQWGKIQW